MDTGGLENATGVGSIHSRARIRRLVLMNWQGVFYQPFELADGLTGLEGPNGAGKTTAMVALFVALLPDLRLLHFRGPGETGSGEGDRGIYGRLGVPGPAYSLIQYVTPQGQSLWAGVLLIRHGEPRLEVTPFLIEGLNPQAEPESVFLRLHQEEEWIPTLAEMKEQVALQGGLLKVQESLTNYLGVLYECGILPLPLATHEERERFHRVLYTSMVGGLSSFIQKGLRDYLLPEDTQLRNHVGRMRENLEACRITRRQIDDAKKRYDTIRHVYEAGWGMLTAAFHGTRLRARQQRDAYDAAAAELRGRRKRRLAAERQHQEATARHHALQAEFTERGNRLEAAKAHRDLARAAHRLAGEIVALERQEHENRARRTEADARRREAEQRRGISYQTHEDAQRRRNELAQALANAQQAYEQLYRNVAALNSARQSLEDAQTALPDYSVTIENARALSDECEQNWQQALEARAEAERAKAEYEAHKKRFDQAFAALERLAEAALDPAQAPESARDLDASYRSRQAEVQAADDLSAAIVQAVEKARRQETVRHKVKELSIANGASLRSALDETRGELAVLEERRGQIANALGWERQTIAQCVAQIPPLEEDTAAWQLAQRLSLALGAHTSTPLSSEPDVAALMEILQRHINETDAQRRSCETETRHLVEEADALAFGGGRIPESLVALADQVDGRLALERFEDVAETDAARLEARLGPLAAAIVVDDPHKAVRTAAGVSERPDTAWFITPESIRTDPEGVTIGDSEIVEAASRVRLTRRPTRPVLGRAAREKEIEHLRAHAEAKQHETTEAMERLQQLKTAYQDAARLLPLASWLSVPSPESDLLRLAHERRQAESRAERLRSEQSETNEAFALANRRLTAVTALLPDAELLDEADWNDVANRLKAKARDVAETKAWLERHRNDWNEVSRGFLDMQSPPDLPHLEVLLRRAQDAQAILDTWQRARELLRVLCERLPDFRHATDEALLEQNESALATLRSRQKDADAIVTLAKTDWDTREKDLQKANGSYNEVDARFCATVASLARGREELKNTGLRGDKVELDEAESDALAAEAAHNETSRNEREADTAARLLQNEVKNLKEREDEALETVRGKLRETRPNWQHWISLKREARKRGLWERLMAMEVRRPYDLDASPVNAFNTATEHLGTLKARLDENDDGRAVAAKISPWLETREEVARGLQNLRAWDEIRPYLERHIPRDIAQAADPEMALVQMHNHLTALSARLVEQEKGLRQRAEDVANSIASRIRREEQRLTQINRGLGHVRFGSLRGVKLNLSRIPTFQNLLDALRRQPDLFSVDVPLEEAMARLFEQVGGGKIRGEQLLDYREYLKLSVEVKRIARDDWIEVRGNNLSTGESIGVGASILMVILGAWEHQAALLRGRRAGNSLRFLFLDEATRLDPGALDTLTDFCERMDVQLFVAAPGLERARRGHVYSLTRVEENGQERVLVRGRRWQEP